MTNGGGNKIDTYLAARRDVQLDDRPDHRPHDGVDPRRAHQRRAAERSARLRHRQRVRPAGSGRAGSSSRSTAPSRSSALTIDGAAVRARVGSTRRMEHLQPVRDDPGRRDDERSMSSSPDTSSARTSRHLGAAARRSDAVGLTAEHSRDPTPARRLHRQRVSLADRRASAPPPPRGRPRRRRRRRGPSRRRERMRVDAQMDVHTLTAAAGIGIDLGDHVARALDREILDRDGADLVLVMTREHLRTVVGLDRPTRGHVRSRSRSSSAVRRPSHRATAAEGVAGWLRRVGEGRRAAEHDDRRPPRRRRRSLRPPTFRARGDDRRDLRARRPPRPTRSVGALHRSSDDATVTRRPSLVTPGTVSSARS